MLYDDVQYRVIHDFPEYRVGSDGSVWSRWHGVGLNRKPTGDWAELSPRVGDDGYKRLVLCSEDGRRRYVRVSRLVLESFDRPANPGEVSRHKNDNPLDNRLENLCWGSVQDNANDRVVRNRSSSGERHYKAKLSDRDVSLVHVLRKRGMTYKAIANEIGRVSWSTVAAICSGRNRSRCAVR